MQKVCLSKLSDMQFVSFVLKSTINEEGRCCEKKILFSFRLNGDNCWIFTHGNRELFEADTLHKLKNMEDMKYFCKLKIRNTATTRNFEVIYK
jgi:hypothetical protein